MLEEAKITPEMEIEQLQERIKSQQNLITVLQQRIRQEEDLTAAYRKVIKDLAEDI